MTTTEQQTQHMTIDELANEIDSLLEKGGIRNQIARLAVKQELFKVFARFVNESKYFGGSIGKG